MEPPPFKLAQAPKRVILPVVERLRNLSLEVSAEVGFPHFFIVWEFVDEDRSTWGLTCGIPGWTGAFKTTADQPGLYVSNDILRGLLKDHFYKLSVQIEQVFNVSNGQYWLKPAYQIPKK